MTQDTRKDPRGKVLSMTVRYKSATVEEFIEHHSHDVSSGGIFIKTSSPYPPGTLLKFEIRIQDEQTVLSGVGRVVWKREPDAAASDSPAGMGVKFIKIDDKSKSLITRLVAAHGGGPSAYDAGKPADEPAESEGGATADSAKPAGPTKAEIAKRGGTLLGIGAIGGAKPKLDAKAPPEPKKEDAGGFFPSTTPESEQPPPEERTVMRQAAELLKQALAEAGGSLDDVGGPLGKDALAAGDKKTETKDAAKPAETAATAAKPADATKPVEAAKPVETAKPAETAKAADVAAPAATDDKPKESARSLALAEQQDDEDEDEDDEDEAVEAKEPPKAAAKAPVKVDEKPKAAEVKPAAKTATTKPAVATATATAKPFGAQQQEEGGGGRLLTILLVVAAVGGALWLFFGQKEPEAPKPAPATNQTSVVTPPTTPAPPVMTAPTPETQPTATAAPTGTAGTAPTTTGTSATTAAPTGTAATTAAPTATAKPTAAPGDTAAPKATTTPRAPKTTPKPKAPADDPYG